MSDNAALVVEPVASIFAFAFGLVIGSFLNVCIHRLPLGQSVVHPRSRCPGCETLIPWYHNIPVLSWIWLRGRCARCSARISWRYPFVELLGGTVVLACWRAYGEAASFPIAAAFTLALVVLFFTDWDHQLLPDAVTLVGFAAGIAVAWFNPFIGGVGWARIWVDIPQEGWARVVAALIGAALGSGVLWSVGAIYGKLRGVEAMGMGDVKMMAMVGAFTGPAGVLFTIFVASLGGAIVGLALIPIGGRSLQDKLPFGCFLAPAALGALLYGRQAVAAYFAMVLPPG